MKPPRPRVEPLEGRTLLSAAGSLDPGFGGGKGYAQLLLGIAPIASGDNYASVQSVAVGPTGTIAVDGTISSQSRQGGQVQETTQTLLTEYNEDGSLDTKFGGDGHVPIGTGFSFLFEPADGKVIEFGPGKDAGGNPSYLAIRIDLDGTPDSTYGTNFEASYPAGATTPAADRVTNPVAAVATLGGKVILVDASGKSVRLDADGSLDTTYGTDGTADPAITVPGGQGTTVLGAVIQTNARSSWWPTCSPDISATMP